MNMKKIVYIALLCAVAQVIWATPTVVTTESALINAVKTNNADIQLGSDIVLTQVVTIEKNVTINMLNHTLDRQCHKRGSQIFSVESGATLELSNGTLTRAWGGAGGAINNKGTAILSNVTISHCTADDRGGAINNTGSLTLTNCVLRNNTCNDHVAPTGGGAIHNNSGATLVIEGNATRITDNTSEDGGAIYNDANGTIIINDAGVFSGNKATKNGGGAITNIGICTIHSATFTGNFAQGRGGALWNGGTLNLNGGSITGNTAHLRGGGITSVNDSLKIQGAITVTGNRDENGLTDNVYLTDGEVLTVKGALTGSHIGIFIDATRAFTAYYSDYNDGVNPSTIFSADLYGRSIVLENEEAKIKADDPGNKIYYIERSWDEANQRVKAEVKNVSSGNYTLVENSGEREDVWNNSYYVVQGEKTLKRVVINENKTIHLILCNGAKLTLTDEIAVYTNAHLHIHDQPCSDNRGKIVSGEIAGKDPDFGGNSHITIHGGDIRAIGSAGGVPGIGFCDSKSGSTVTIYSGDIYAEGSDGGAGIGGCGYSVHDGKIYIYGGTIDARGASTITSESGAGIGAGDDSYGGEIYIYGGDIKATGGNEAAGIGTAQGADESTYQVHIYGGRVVARGDNYGAGIGGGDGIDGCTVEITGGRVYAYGGTDAAGIGGGEGGNGGKVTISGGYVYAEGNDNGAGIGGGEDGNGGNITITGGTVITKTTGTDDGSRAIGPGDGSDNYGQLSLGDAQMVISERVFSAAERKNACWYRTNVVVTPCDHSGHTTYTVDGCGHNDHHISHCEYCLHSDTALHTFENNTCTVCGVQASTSMIRMYLPKEQADGSYDGLTYYNYSGYEVVPGKDFKLPINTTILPGLKFAGWEATTYPTDSTYTSPYTTHPATLYQTGDLYTVNGDICFVARYARFDIDILDDAYNGDTLAKYNGRTVGHATLVGRTLVKNDYWQTFALPFSLSAEQITAGPLRGMLIKQLDLNGWYDDRKIRYNAYKDGCHQTGYDLATNTLYLYFENATAIEQGKPYVIKWRDGDNITGPIFDSVTVTYQTANVNAPFVSFVSLYSPKTFEATNNRVVYIGDKCTFLQPDGENAVTINACRAYFRLNKFALANANANALTIVTNLEGAKIGREEGLENIGVDDTTLKYLQNGILFINKNNHIYTITGQKIK